MTPPEGWGMAIPLCWGIPGITRKPGMCPPASTASAPPFDVPGEAFMALRLSSGAPRLDGTVLYDRAFGMDA